MGEDKKNQRELCLRIIDIAKERFDCILTEFDAIKIETMLDQEEGVSDKGIEDEIVHYIIDNRIQAVSDYSENRYTESTKK